MEFNDFLDIFERKYFGYFWNGNIISIFFFLKTGDPLSILGRYFESLTSFWKWYFIEVISHVFYGKIFSKKMESYVLYKIISKE